MKNRKVFCEECRRDVDFIVNDKQMVGIIKGETYEYTGKLLIVSTVNLKFMWMRLMILI